MGAGSATVPFRSQGGQPSGKTQWHEIKVEVLNRLGQHCTQIGKVVTRLYQRRLVTVLGDIEAFKPRLWLAAVRQSLLSAPQVVWLSDGVRGWVAAARGVLLCLCHGDPGLLPRLAEPVEGRSRLARWGLGRPGRGIGSGELA
jgi:hypothetical protein